MYGRKKKRRFSQTHGAWIITWGIMILTVIIMVLNLVMR